MTHRLFLTACVPLACVVLTAPATGVQTPPADAGTLLERAIAAAGGEKALEAAAALQWSAQATVHTPRGEIRIEGRWLVEPPDRAVVTTWEADKGPSTTRRMLLDGSRGWMELNAERTPMPAATLANERDQFYLYSVMRLLPLRDPGVKLTLVRPGTLLIADPRRPDVEASFDGDGRLLRLRTNVSHPDNNSDIVQEMTFEGTISAGGVRWPRTIRIVQDGRPFFEMTLIELSIASRDELTAALGR